MQLRAGGRQVYGAGESCAAGYEKLLVDFGGVRFAALDPPQTVNRCGGCLIGIIHYDVVAALGQAGAGVSIAGCLERAVGTGRDNDDHRVVFVIGVVTGQQRVRAVSYVRRNDRTSIPCAIAVIAAPRVLAVRTYRSGQRTAAESDDRGVILHGFDKLVGIAVAAVCL